MTTKISSARTAEVRKREHGNCVVCSSSNERGLGIEFNTLEDGSVEAVFECDKTYEGYKDLLHGGIISALLDGAMTNCMFAQGSRALTAELNVRFHQPVAIGSPAKVRAWIKKDLFPLFLVEAEVSQNQQVKASATGKFMESDQ